jgi:hypothetical protein
MAKKKPAPLRIDGSWGSASVYSTHGITCPLCKTKVPPNVQHDCEKDPGKPARVIR